MLRHHQSKSKINRTCFPYFHFLLQHWTITCVHIFMLLICTNIASTLKHRRGGSRQWEMVNSEGRVRWTKTTMPPFHHASCMALYRRNRWRGDAADNDEEMGSKQPNAWLPAGLVLMVVVGSRTLAQIQGERKHTWKSERRSSSPCMTMRCIAAGEIDGGARFCLAVRCICLR